MKRSLATMVGLLVVMSCATPKPNVPGQHLDTMNNYVPDSRTPPGLQNADWKCNDQDLYYPEVTSCSDPWVTDTRGPSYRAQQARRVSDERQKLVVTQAAMRSTVSALPPPPPPPPIAAQSEPEPRPEAPVAAAEAQPASSNTHGNRAGTGPINPVGVGDYRRMTITDLILDHADMPRDTKIAIEGTYIKVTPDEVLSSNPQLVTAPRIYIDTTNAPRASRAALLECLANARFCKGVFLGRLGCRSVSTDPCLTVDEIRPARLDR